MSLSRAVSIINLNRRKRENRYNETVEESFLRRSNRNEQNRAKRFCVQSEVSRLQEHSCGTMTGLCSFCLARFWEKEVNSSVKYTKCCHDKKIILPEILKDLLTSDSLESKNYWKHTREYNSALAFASMGAQIQPPPGTGPYCYRIHGQIYHMVSPLYSDHNKPGYGQLYIFDTSKATEKCMFTLCYGQIGFYVEGN
ncbi:hypothetical protein AVEN_73612-1 [Araneus ventricosus]|uniref:Helitron helicase-like domain-containing protein n=1 Tax=Araneus ventricosus TaxID=182803 RepID=A0A4Y2W7H0_ARAVE|nr:hypothetical protein AVEN_73612-1 [Araneus ventricosus]